MGEGYVFSYSEWIHLPYSLLIIFKVVIDIYTVRNNFCTLLINSNRKYSFGIISLYLLDYKLLFNLIRFYYNYVLNFHNNK